jgi:hypothetical protein
MPPVPNWFIVFCLAAYILQGICLLSLWVFAFARIRHYSLFLLVLASIASVLFSCVSFVQYSYGQWLFHVLGEKGRPVYYYAFSGVQLAFAVFSVVSLALFVFWLSRTYDKMRSRT